MVSPSHVRLSVPLAQPGTVLVFVFNPPDGGTTLSGAIGVTSTTSCSGKNSNAIPFAVNP
jgi:hypothetical protein